MPDINGYCSEGSDCYIDSFNYFLQLKKSQEEVQQQTGHVRSLEQQLARVQTQMASDVKEKEDVIDKLKVENTKLQVKGRI